MNYKDIFERLLEALNSSREAYGKNYLTVLVENIRLASISLAIIALELREIRSQREHQE